jgi:hypothetical protein
MTYRNDESAEEARTEALRAELDRIAGERAAEERLRARRGELRGALADLEQAARARRAKMPLPILARVSIASPCTASWDDMKGDERVRHCAHCDKDVYDLSEMTTAEAEALLSREGPAACVRLHRRADGTVITSDCPVGVQKKRRRRWLAAGAAVAASAVAAFGARSLVTRNDGCRIADGGDVTTMGEPMPMMMGAVAVMPPPPPPSDNPVPAVAQPEVRHVVMGGPRVHTPPPPPTHAPRRHRRAPSE